MVHLLLDLHIGGGIGFKKLLIVIALSELVLLPKPDDRTHSRMLYVQPVRPRSSHAF
jgi:hypothetical protein